MSSQSPYRPSESSSWQAQPHEGVAPESRRYPPSQPPVPEQPSSGYVGPQPYYQPPGYVAAPQQPPVYYQPPPVVIVQQPVAKPAEPTLYWAIWLTVILYILFLPAGYVASLVSYLIAKSEKKQTGREKKGFTALRVIWWIGNVALMVLALMAIVGLIGEAVTGQLPK